jgi:hypothetical protein
VHVMNRVVRRCFLLGDDAVTRCSDEGFLPISVAAYLELLDWTARQTVSGKRGSTPSEAPPILKRLKVSASTWCELVSNFGRLFSTVAGHHGSWTARAADADTAASTLPRVFAGCYPWPRSVCDPLRLLFVAVDASGDCRPIIPAAGTQRKSHQVLLAPLGLLFLFCVDAAIRPSCVSFPVPLDATGR